MGWGERCAVSELAREQGSARRRWEEVPTMFFVHSENSISDNTLRIGGRCVVCAACCCGEVPTIVYFPVLTRLY